MLAYPNADWNFWEDIPDVAIWEGVALSLDIDPELIRDRIRDNKLLHDFPEFAKRLDLATRNWRRFTRISASNGYPAERKVTKIDFPNLAREWECPTEMWEWELAAEANKSDAPAPEKHEIKILNLKQQVETLTQERNELRAEVADLTAKLPTIPGERSETTYLNIIAALLGYIEGDVSEVEKHPSFKSETELIAVLASSERVPIFRTGKLMVLYQLARSFHETYSPSYFCGWPTGWPRARATRRV